MSEESPKTPPPPNETPLAGLERHRRLSRTRRAGLTTPGFLCGDGSRPGKGATCRAPGLCASPESSLAQLSSLR